MKIDLNRLNVMNYMIHDLECSDYWYADNGLRSLYRYSKMTSMSFKEICQTLNDEGQVILKDYKISITMI